MRSLKNTVEATPAVWVHGVISQIAEKPSGVYLSIADFADGDVKPKATLALYISSCVRNCTSHTASCKRKSWTSTLFTRLANLL